MACLSIYAVFLLMIFHSRSLSRVSIRIRGSAWVYSILRVGDSSPEDAMFIYALGKHRISIWHVCASCVCMEKFVILLLFWGGSAVKRRVYSCLPSGVCVCVIFIGFLNFTAIRGNNACVGPRYL